MAGSITTIVADLGTTNSTTNHTYRVTIDIHRIQANVFACEGGRLSDQTVRTWLRSVGFIPEPGAHTWVADAETLHRLDKSEIVRAERIYVAPRGGPSLVS
jgi:hypothetical protein